MTTFNTAWNARRAARRSGAETPVDLRQMRAWYAANVSLYGFTEIKDLYAARVITIDVQTLQTAISEAARYSTEQLNALLSGLVQRTTQHQYRYQLPGAGTLQPLDEKGNPLPIIPGGVYDVAFPLLRAGTAWGTDRVSRAKMTVADAARYTLDALLKDVDWNIRHILAALFTNVTYTYTDPAFGALTVQPLANADATTLYVRTDGSTATDTHFFAQAAGIADATDPFTGLYTALAHHPGNSGPFVAYIATDLVATTMALSGFAEVSDPDVVYSNTNPVLGTNVVNLNNNQYGEGSMLGIGTRVLGKVDGMWIVEWSRLPSGYIFAHATGANDIVAMREEPEAELQGFFPEYFSPDGNLQETRMLRMAGYGIQNRIGAAITRIGNASYAVPTGFLAPLVA
jgi:hypothetical protein